MKSSWDHDLIPRRIWQGKKRYSFPRLAFCQRERSLNLNDTTNFISDTSIRPQRYYYWATNVMGRGKPGAEIAEKSPYLFKYSVARVNLFLTSDI
ncbi:hypothetical protein VN97_g939 [Penicillium thymicola]|uniref:Uncharacterized protein n=1 Tax=Penicillium thymicola TaxID=293382 RepID=A0AAI9TTA2_PENTH|nr:hypothetical protein VN97_g939 [Penicillium thymicola]